jgi:GT2 family glycosyltransferase
MNCAALILHYNNTSLLDGVLTSLRGEEGLDAIVVIDNASTDTSITHLKTHHHDVEIIQNKENLNYGTAYNRAIATRSEEIILILNNDTIVHPGSVKAAVGFLRDNLDVASVSFEGLDRNKGSQPFPCNPCGPIRKFGKVLSPGRSFSSRFDAPVDARYYLWGAACAIRKDIFMRVKFDESMDWYFEDIDLGWSIRRKTGMKNVFIPSATIYHEESTTSRSRFDELRISRMSTRNAIISFSKNGTLLDWLRGLPAILLYFLQMQDRRKLASLVFRNVLERINCNRNHRM